MAKILNLATFVTLAVAATLLGHTSAATYIVGSTGLWAYPSDATAYATWASQYNFTVGDVLVFNFTTDYHTVATVTKESFDSCNINNPIGLITTGPASITLTSPEETYFICTVGQHCKAGQKLAINVIAPSTSSPPSPPPSIEEPTPSPLPETTTPPALGPGGPTPTGSIIPPTPATTPPALGPGGPAPTGGPTSSVSPPTSSVPPPPQGSSPPSSGGAVPPTSTPPSSATRTGLASIFTIFISAGVYLLF